MDQLEEIEKYWDNAKYIPEFILNSYFSYKLCRNIRINNQYKRIYHFHVRKTGGTSLNYSFLSLSGTQPSKVYSALAKAHDNRFFKDGRVFVGWNRFSINTGWYFYAFSHTPAHKIRIPKDTYAFTILRNPVDRVVSLYKMIKYYKDSKINNLDTKIEGNWQTNDFNEFIDKIPKSRLFRQIYMFSRRMNTEEALDNLTGKCNRVLFTDRLREGTNKISKDLNIKLPYFHVRKSPTHYGLSTKEMKKLKRLLEPELDFYYRAKKLENV